MILVYQSILSTRRLTSRSSASVYILIGIGRWSVVGGSSVGSNVGSRSVAGRWLVGSSIGSNVGSRSVAGRWLVGSSMW